MPTPRVFVSHNHNDNDYCREFVKSLRELLGSNDAVWYDEHNLGWGALRSTIEKIMPLCQHFIAIFSPDAVASDWVNAEIDAALDLHKSGTIKTIMFVVARPCDVPLLLKRYKRIEQPGGLPFPPAAAAARAHRVITEATPNDDDLPPLGPASAPATSTPAHHLTPQRIYDLGYRGYTVGSVECILPPLCPVPAGIFTMGSDKTRDEQASDAETPQYPVQVAGFALGQHPVTVAEYACALRAKDKPVREPPVYAYQKTKVDWATQQSHPDHPVVRISWKDALAYVRWLAKVTGQPWRLPNEAEWEKAARGTDGRIYPWGATFDKARCNTDASGISTTTPVGSYPHGESPYHAQDMAGNVWEWTSTIYQRYPYRKDDAHENLDSTDNRVLRGGSWASGSRLVRAAYRRNLMPRSGYRNFGFRVAFAADS